MPDLSVIPMIRRLILGPSYRQRTGNRTNFPCCVLLTATITPPQTAVARYDPQLRLDDYLESLGFYLSLPSDYVNRIVFIDNSASDITPVEDFVIKQIHDKAVEIISFEGNNHPISYGKAYGEFRLMDFGLDHSSLLGTDDIFWKVTGRLRVLNMTEMILAIREKYDVLCDLHSFPLIGTGKVFGNKWMDLRVFSSSVRAYQCIFKGANDALKSSFDQSSIYRLVMNAPPSLNVIRRFPIQPVIVGFSGRHNRDYFSGLQKFKTNVRAWLRRTAPRLWI